MRTLALLVVFSCCKAEPQWGQQSRECRPDFNVRFAQPVPSGQKSYWVCWMDENLSELRCADVDSVTSYFQQEKP